MGRDCHTPLAHRAPETLFEPDKLFSYPADIWSLATTIWKMLGMKANFSGFSRDELIDHQMKVLSYDKLPSEWWEHWIIPRSGEVDAHIPRRPKRDKGNWWPDLDEQFEDFVQRFRRDLPETGIFGKEESPAILELMHGMFRFRPGERLTVDEVLQSEWMVKWALPALKEHEDFEEADEADEV